jgi:glycine cleavage system transcriptional repressor
MAQLIVTAVGDDRPGLVGELTGYLHTAGANILDTRMVNLRGRFAVMVLLEAPDVAGIKKALPTVSGGMGLTVHLAEQGASAAVVKGMPFKLKTYSLDQPGLVHRISEVLRGNGVNIEELSARQESAAFAGDPRFIMEMRLTVPAGVAVRKLRAELEGVCEKVNADMDLEAA